MSYDAVIIGGGPGGYVAAIRIAQLGGRAALVEKDELGGTCLNRGCIPTKALVAAADRLSMIKNAGEFGIEFEAEPRVNFSKVQERKNSIVRQLVSGIHFLVKKHRIDLFSGVAEIQGPNAVSVSSDGEPVFLSCRSIIVATGSRPALIPSFRYDGDAVITSDEALMLPAVPESLLIVGAGVIGCEFAHIYAGLGSKIVLLEAEKNILPFLDRDMARRMALVFKKRGIEVQTGQKIQEIRKTVAGIRAVLADSGRIDAEKALIAVGRRLNTENVGLENAGIDGGEGHGVPVDEKMETRAPGVYAIGDVTGLWQLAHVASAQGIVAAENIMGRKAEMDYTAVPNCIYTHPEIAGVGITEQQAKDEGIPVKKGRFNFTANGRALCMGEAEGVVRMLSHADSDVVLGVHIMGPHASDLIAEATLAVRRKMTAAELARTIHAHPSLSETLAEAAENVHGMSIHA